MAEAVVESVSGEDRRDIEASLRGDERAYGRLVERYQSLIAAQMWRFSRDPVVVEELVQEAFVECYLGLSKFRGQSPFLHWIRRIATRVGYRHWKIKARDKRKEDALALEPKPDVQMPADPAPAEAAAWLQGILAQLPPEDRLVLTLHYFEDLDMNGIAQRMGWTRSLAKVRAFRARKRLKTLLKEAGYEQD